MKHDLPDDEASYELIRAVKSEIGRELMLRYGAHAIGIVRKVQAAANDGEPVLTFYVDPGAGPAVPVPRVIEHTLEGHATAVRVPTQVLERHRAERG